MNNHLSLTFLPKFKSCAFFAIICNRFHKCVGKMSVFFSPFPIILLPNSQCRWGIGGSRRSPEPGRRFTAGSLGFFHPGAPTATLTCEEKVSLLLEGEHTRKKCRFSSKRGRVQVLIQRLFGFFGCIFCLFVCLVFWPRKVAVFRLHKSTRQQGSRTRRVPTPREVEAKRCPALLQHFFGRR